MKYDTINSWEELTALPGLFDTDMAIFRGVSDVGHKLIPQIGRPETRKNVLWEPEAGSSKLPQTGTYSSNDAEKMLNRFRKQARPYLEWEPERHTPEEDDEWLCIASHHGLPTEMLDWSTSPLIAAYFAVESAGFSKRKATDAAVYMMQIIPNPPEGPREEMVFLDNDKRVYVYFPRHNNRRVAAQRGLFSRHNDPLIPLDSDLITQYKIPHDLRLSFKNKLDKCGFNRATLFPDLDGLALHLKWEYKWNRLSF